MKLFLKTTDPKASDVQRKGFVTDQDVIKLLKLKEDLYPIYNYEQLNR